MLREHEYQSPDSNAHTNIHHVEADIPREDLPPMYISGTITPELIDTAVSDAEAKIISARKLGRVTGFSGRVALSD